MVTKVDLEKQFTETMKSIARRGDLKAYVEQTPSIYHMLQRAAAKYVTGEDRTAGLEAGLRLINKGYAVSLEYIGENATDVQSCEAAALEMKQLIKNLTDRGMAARVSFDLSHIGLSVDDALAFKHLATLADQTQQTEIELFISMEESAKTEAILAIYERAAAIYPNIGITLQAQLHLTAQYMNDLQADPRRLRLVKGAYQEPKHLAISRSDALNERYLHLLEQSIDKGHRVSIATHDERIVDEVINRGWALKPGVEFEMLYGIRPDLSSKLRKAGYPVRIYLTYGHEWYLYLCHRIAEYPPNLYQAVIDIASDEPVDSAMEYE
ncbi:proline dehydrogenase family protein [Paenibacillus sp. PR3]|uniref:proline dehydrogenase n=1 Tax=Paenibacillus terricola TaxID=2763503 RepID=A0ABR8N3H3_9BACL|nr:proline dehydrogenase family protein [Paenibacillus terricola]MBD3922719.1 proline dehydrogenase family protein [Paenibacillus terricola]